MKQKQTTIYIFGFLALLMVMPSFVFAYNKFSPGDTATIGEFLYEDDFTPSTTDCTITVTDPSGDLILSAVTMSERADGWHYHDFVPASEVGIWPAIMICGSGADIVKTDKTFEVGLTEIDNDGLAASVWGYTTRSLTTFGTLVADIWGAGTRTLTGIGALAADIWNDGYAPTRQLTDAGLSGGGTLTSQAYLTSSLGTTESNILAGVTDAEGNITTAIGASESNITDAIDASQTAVTDAIDDSTSSTSTSLSSAQVAITNAISSSQGTVTGAITTSQTAVTNAIASSESDIIDEVLENRTLINALNNVSAADVWAHGTRSINSGTVNLSTASKEEIWDVAAADLTTLGSIGKQIADNLDAQVSSRGVSNLTAGDVWAAATRTLTDYSSSSVATAVWANGARTLTNYGNDITAQQVWDVLSSSLTTIGSVGEQVVDNLDLASSTRASLSSQQAGWTVRMSDVDRQMATKVYRAKLSVLNFESNPTAPFAVPQITIYDALRNAVVTDGSMTSIATGVYEYTYTIGSSPEQGLWESVVVTQVESGKSITTNDYWEVTSSPAQVLINNVTDLITPEIIANVTITNEGLTGYEYQYEWCVVTDSGNPCGGGDDVYFAEAAKFINPGEDFNTNLSATVSTPGNYVFKLVVYFGLENSKASRTFTAVADDDEPPPSGGGGGGGGSITPTPTACNGADFNADSLVNSVDFSILLAFWKTPPPFRNPCVDVNKDSIVDSVDFSILLFQWGAK